MAGSYPEGAPAILADKRQQFGSRFLSDPARVFHHNAWDNVEWSEEQAAAAERKVQENSIQRVCQEKQVDYEINAHKYWNDFYKIHENGFFKDRHWLFTEFPELAPSQNQNHLKDWFLENKSEVCECRNNEDGPGLIMEEQHKCSSKSLEHKTQTPPVEENVTQKISDLEICADEFPGSSATYRILEVGCGVGNTVFPILQTNNDPGLFVYCCDFSSTAIELVQTNSEYDPSRCFAFVHDLCDEEKSYPVPKGSLDIIILIFVLSAVVPDKMQKAINRLSRLLKPGGMVLLRDYGRYDMAQLRFKKGQCLSGNFYVRGDGTRVYFFTQEELDTLFTTAGLEKVQNLVDRRLQVNRGKQLTMYRVWIQCKYCKPLLSSTS
ncbi:tRNA N(3)-cytidine methyltransferase METTL2B [Homo sapiens]|uniref:tRNA N(3)-cytidine methyltransferase METTL2B n=1 Tax=Homo sapiens TaxID=9606 RepID=MET2B_HUMAN|nr:tRNA N(3)-methylcytidine methyltransferase METTL2B [Homo sapiens]Q6P1Q9.3 RecName: Full=tRNA N(3)-methylcytidine methyltransferase METTL2B; AltName: Full=Methyltransferase-like protein 2B [Homo sapiens]|eukprot:NP_060866.2 methyltransferase-like protein 2B [Homo sapiens]